MSRVIAICVVAALATAGASGPAAADAAAAKQRVQNVCAACHGPAGVSVNPLYPNLAGQQGAYLAKALRDYRDGKRSDPLMTAMAQGLSDQDVDDLAAYFAGLAAGS